MPKTPFTDPIKTAPPKSTTAQVPQPRSPVSTDPSTFVEGPVSQPPSPPNTTTAQASQPPSPVSTHASALVEEPVSRGVEVLNSILFMLAEAGVELDMDAVVGYELYEFGLMALGYEV